MRLTDTALRVERVGIEMVQARQVQDTIPYATDMESVWNRSKCRGRKRGGRGEGFSPCGEFPHPPHRIGPIGGDYDPPIGFSVQ